jgi:hypothetical protein
VAFLSDGRHIIFFECVYEVIINSHVHVELEQFFEFASEKSAELCVRQLPRASGWSLT